MLLRAQAREMQLTYTRHEMQLKHTRYDCNPCRLIKKTFPASVPAIYLDALKAAYARIEPTGADCEPALAPPVLARLASAWVLLPLAFGALLLQAAQRICLHPACPEDGRNLNHSCPSPTSHPDPCRR